jgi:HAD superfamily hydrolase (TIGR01544 family)
MGECYLRETTALFNKYYAIEVDPRLSPAEKTPHMASWNTEVHALMVEIGLHRDDLARIAATPHLQLRDGAADLLRGAHAHGVPVHVFSAGLADVITAFLAREGLAPHAHVVGNMMRFDSDTGRLAGFHGALLHPLNKRGAAVRGSPTWPLTAHRRAVIIVGDNVGDALMADGLFGENDDDSNSNENTVVLRVGVFNVSPGEAKETTEHRLSQHLAAFDMVIAGAESLAPLAELLHRVARA